MRRIVLKYGLIAGLMMSSVFVGTLLLRGGDHDFDNGLIIGYASMVLAFLMVYFGVRAYRDRVGGGRIGFWRAFGVGMAIVAVATACYVATWEVIYFKFTPDFMEKYAAYALEKARQGGATAAELAAKKAEMEQFAVAYRNPLVNIAYTALEPLPVGLLFALVSAFVLSRGARREEEVVGAVG